MRNVFSYPLLALMALALSACDMTKPPVTPDPDPDPITVEHELITAFGPLTYHQRGATSTSYYLDLTLSLTAPAESNHTYQVTVLTADGEPITTPSQVRILQGDENTRFANRLPDATFEPGVYHIVVTLGDEEVARDQHDLTGYTGGLPLPGITATIDREHITVELDGHAAATTLFAFLKDADELDELHATALEDEGSARFTYDPDDLTYGDTYLVSLMAAKDAIDGSASVTTQFLHVLTEVELEQVVSAYVTYLEGGALNGNESDGWVKNVIGTLHFPLGAPAADELTEDVAFTFHKPDRSFPAASINSWEAGAKTVSGLEVHRMQAGDEVYVIASFDGRVYRSPTLVIESDVASLEPIVMTETAYTADELRLAWNAVDGANLYIVWVGTLDGLHLLKHETVETSATFTPDSGVPFGGDLYYQLLAAPTDPFAPANQIVPGSVSFAQLRLPAD